MSVWSTNYLGNPNLGLYARASDRLMLVPLGAPAKFLEGAGALGVPLFAASIDRCPYLGVYTALNSRGVILPSFADEGERARFKESGLDVLVVHGGHFCAIGNNIACNDKAAIVNPDMPRELVKRISDTLGVEVHPMKVGPNKTVGMAVAPTNKGWVAYNRISEEESRTLAGLFGAPGINATVNNGTIMVGLGVVANSHGALIGMASSGFEIGRIQQGLDLI